MANIAIRYYSRAGHTRLLGEAISEELGVKAVPINRIAAEIKKPVDILFIGAAVYANNVDKQVLEFIDTLSAEKVGKAVLYSTSRISKKAFPVMRAKFEEKGIPVADETFYAWGKPSKKAIEEVKKFARSFVD